MPPQTHMDQPYPEGHRFTQRNAQPYPEHLRAQAQGQPHDAPAAASAASPSRMSRRSILRGAAGVGAVGLAAAAGAGAVAAATRQSSPQALKSAALTEVPSDALSGPLVVYIADASSGQFDVFAGTGQVRVDNPDLVGQLLANLKQA